MYKLSEYIYYFWWFLLLSSLPLCHFLVLFFIFGSHTEKLYGKIAVACVDVIDRYSIRTTSMDFMTSDVYQLCPLVKQIIYRNQKSIGGSMMALQEIIWLISVSTLYIFETLMFFFSLFFLFSFLFCFFFFCALLIFGRLTVHLVIYHYLPAFGRTKPIFLSRKTSSTWS